MQESETNSDSSSVENTENRRFVLITTQSFSGLTSRTSANIQPMNKEILYGLVKHSKKHGEWAIALRVMLLNNPANT